MICSFLLGCLNFLNPSIKNFLPNPNNLLDMKKSSLRTLEAIKNKEKIGVFGDYDVDGATSAALLGKYFKLPIILVAPTIMEENNRPILVINNTFSCFAIYAIFYVWFRTQLICNS